MKKLIFAALAAMLMVAMPSQAQVKLGIKAGVNINNMSYDSKVLSADNRTGFYVGPTVRFSLPVVGLGMDASLLYDQRSFESGATYTDENNQTYSYDTKMKTQQLTIPLNVRYNLIGTESLAALYVYGGPQIAFNLGNKQYKDWTLRSSNFSCNVGLGVMVASRIQVTANYNIAMGKTGEQNITDIAGTLTGVAGEAAKVAAEQIAGTAKANAWQIGVAYYF